MLQLKNCCNIKEFWEQNCVWPVNYFNCERNYDVLKSKSPCILLNKNINFNKNGMKSKMENRTHSLETNLKLQLIWESQIKSKTVMSEIKKRLFFVPFILSKGIFFNICLLSQWCIFLHIRKHYVIHFCCLFLKSSKAFSCILKKISSKNTQQIYRRTLMPKCDFNKVALRLYWNRTSA